MNLSNRTTWVSALTALPVLDLLALTRELSANWQVRPKSVPQSGLGMLKLNDSAFNEPFYLGEIPVASAWLEVRTADGQIVQGAAQVMDDRVDVAEALALCDAIMFARLPGWQQVAALVEQGMRAREAISLERKRILAYTQVDFSLLDDVGDDDAAT